MKTRIPLLGDVVERLLNNCFYRLGEFVGKHPLPFLAIPVAVTVVLSLGLINMSVETDLRKLLTPIDAPSRDEYQASIDFNSYSTQNSGIRWEEVQVLFYVKDETDNNMLAHNRSDVVVDFDRYVRTELNYTFDGNDFNFGRRIYDRFPFLELLNRPLFAFLTISNNKKLSSNPNVHFNYPILDMFGVKFYLGFHIMGVPPESNRSEPIKEAKLIQLKYGFDVHAINSSFDEFEAFRKAAESHADSVRGSKDVEIIITSRGKAESEAQRNTLACVPFLPLTCLLVTAFTVISTITSDPVTTKSLEAVFGGVACVMAIASTFGLLFAFGLSFNLTVAVMPFLAFAIGIDDTFLALSSWHSTDSSLPPHKRLAMSLRESGTAITVTSLTDVVLFGLCAITATPAIRVFSIFTSIAMAFDYIYQLTFFTAILAYAGRREGRRAKSCVALSWPSPKIHDDAVKENGQSEIDLKFVQKQLALSVHTDKLTVSRLIRTRYGPFLNHSVTKISIFVVYIFYVVFSFYGCTRLRININNGRGYLDDSSLQPLFSYLQPKYAWENVETQIIVRKAPDFRNETEQVEFEQFVSFVESTNFSRGQESTVLWYRDYQKYISFIDHAPDEFYKYLKEFLDVSVHSFYKGQLHWTTKNGSYKDDPNATVFEFFFGTTFTAAEHGWEGRLDLLHVWREMSKRFARYDVVFYNFESCFIDQYDTMDDETNQQVGIGVAGMVLMAAVFIPSVSSIFWVAWTLLSMDFGIVAILTLSGCDLDPVVMMDVVMSLDFAVEYAAHVCHRYYVSKESSDSDKVTDTLAAVGWPVLQGGMAAILAVLPMVFVRSYIVRTFLKTIIAVVGLGLIHALVFLPVFVSTVSQSRYLPSKSAARVRKELNVRKFS